MRNDKSSLTIGTLGPKGTSSEAAAMYFAQQNKAQLHQHSIRLFDNFQLVLDALVHADLSMAIIPHAFSDINLFYINPQVRLYHMFVFDTPAYGLAKRPDTVVPRQFCKIVSHPAPVIALKTLSEQMGLTDYEVKWVHSTSQAAREVSEKKADLALTNWNAMQQFNLTSCAMYGAIQMGWSVFTKKDVAI